MSSVDKMDDGSPEQIVCEKNIMPVTVHNVDEKVHDLAEKLVASGDEMAPIEDIEYVMDKINTLTIDECKDIIKKLLKDHEYDYNLGNALREKLSRLIEGPSEGQDPEEWELQLKTETALNHFYSPYPEV